MKKQKLLRACGLASFIGGLLEILIRIPQFTIFEDQPLSILAGQPGFVWLLGLPSLVAGILITFGVLGVFILQAESSGTFGLVAFLTAFVGVLLSIGANWTYAFVSPVLAQQVPYVLEGDPAGRGLITALMVSYLSAQVGLLFLGFSMLWAGVFPRWVSWTLIGSILAVWALSPFAGTQGLRFLYNILIGAGPIVIGYYLFTLQIITLSDADREK